MSNNVDQMHVRADIDAELAIVDYVAGRLDEVEREAFEQRMATDPSLAAQVEEERELSAEIGGAIATEIPAAGAFDKLRAETKPPLSVRSGRWKLAAVAASIVVGVSIVTLLPKPDDEYVTLSSDSTQAVDNLWRYRVVFAESLDAEQREATAATHGFRIVEGPGAGGAYVVDADGEQVREDLDVWRTDPRIELAEPIRYETRQQP